MASAGIKAVHTPYQTPTANAVVERFIGSARCECLDRLLITSQRHLLHALSLYVSHYNAHRPHRALGLRALDPGEIPPPNMRPDLILATCNGATCWVACYPELHKYARHAIMRSMHKSKNKGLRERKHAATYRAIEEAAVEVALEYGYEAATAETIAERANVSLRTLFNYFPSKDQAIAGRGITLVNEERARELLDECAPDVFRGTARIVAAATADMDFDLELMRRRHDLIFHNPPLLRQQLMAIQELEERLARIVANYLRDEPSRRRLSDRVAVDEEARLVVTVVGAAIRYGMEMWLENDPGDLDPAQAIADAIDLMAEIHRKDS